MAVYFIADGDYIKIGYSVDPESRINQLQTGHYRPLELVHVVEGGLDVERYYHNLFSEYRVHGEWFNISRQQLFDELEIQLEANTVYEPEPDRYAYIDELRKTLIGSTGKYPVWYANTDGEWRLIYHNHAQHLMARYYSDWARTGNERLASFYRSTQERLLVDADELYRIVGRNEQLFNKPLDPNSSMNNIKQFMDCLNLNPFERVLMRKWLLNTVGKVLNGDHNFMLVLRGANVWDQIDIAQWLCPNRDYYYQGSINPNSEKDAFYATMRWIWLHTPLKRITNEKNWKSWKQFIATSTYSAGEETARPVTASLISIVSYKKPFLYDPSGNHLFAVLDLRNIDYGFTELDVNQLWAEVTHHYNQGERGTFTEDELASLAIHNRPYTIHK